MADRYHSDRVAFDVLGYQPGAARDTGDLEAGTRTITAQAEAQGLAGADYTGPALVLAAPADARIIVNRIAARLAVTVDSLSAGASLRCRAYVDAQDADHMLFDETWAAAGAKLDALDTHSGSKAVVFNLLKDGGPHTLYLFFWKDAAGTGATVVSLVQAWYAVGTCSTDGGAPVNILQANHTGLMQVQAYYNRAGTGNVTGKLGTVNETYNSFVTATGGDASCALPAVLVGGALVCAASGTVATDICYLRRLFLALRKE